MKRQAIWKTSITTTAEAAEAVMELLSDLVAPRPSVYTDAATGTSTASTYSLTRPAGIAATKLALKVGLKAIKACNLDIGMGRIAIRKLRPENWADSWKRHFPPLEIGKALLVKPSWSRRKPRARQALVVLDPGLSFGTGQHPTTAFCLQALVRGRDLALSRPCSRSTDGTKRASASDAIRRIPRVSGAAAPRRRRLPLSFLDIGTGSGILAISAAKLDYSPIHAFDFDPQCVRVAKANAAVNRVEKKIRITRGDLTRLPLHTERPYDIVCANLLANLLIAERDRILARVKPDGVLVVAGILNREFPAVQTAYGAAGWRLVASKVQKEWRSGSFAKHAM